MLYLIYDGSFGGFLTAVFESYALKQTDIRIVKDTGCLPPLFTKKQTIAFDEEKSKRVYNKLKAIIKHKGMGRLWAALLYESNDVECTLLSVIRYILQTNRDVLTDFSHAGVLALNDILKKVGREKHRMLGFVRFQQAKDGIYYALIEPDYNVLPLMAPHFRRRYADQQWLIFDVKRNYGIFYNEKQVVEVSPVEEKNKGVPSLPTIVISDDEKNFSSLWQSYYKHATIENRQNKKLFLQFIPKRYWKYLTERQMNEYH